MYNRYIPQPDGSFRRGGMQEQANPPHPPKPAPCPPDHKPPEPEPKQAPPCTHMRPPRPYRPNPPRKEPEDFGITGFLRQMLPKDFDTADLIVVLLLLLMSADGCNDNSALLTLALYLFL